ncbi:MAG: hypothetical protein R3C68_13450 [Myxococcota bacterium]
MRTDTIELRLDTDAGGDAGGDVSGDGQGDVPGDTDTQPCTPIFSDRGWETTVSTGATYYIAPAGGSDAPGQGLTQATPWASFAHAWSMMVAGDTLLLLDGTYGTPLRPTISGTVDAPITIRARNDGAVTIETTGATNSCVVQGASSVDRLRYIHIAGIRCQSSLDVSNIAASAVVIHYASNITLRRVSAHTQSSVPTSRTVIVWSASDVLLEDVAATAGAVLPILLFEGAEPTERIILRRVWGYSGTPGAANVFTVNGASGNLLENVIATMDPTNTSRSVGIAVGEAEMVRQFGNIVTNVDNWAFQVSSSSKRVQGNSLSNGVGIETQQGLAVQTDADFRARDLTFTGQTGRGVFWGLQPEVKDSDFEMNAVVRNVNLAFAAQGVEITDSPLIRSIDIDFTNIFTVTTPYTARAMQMANDTSINPMYDVNRYGRGAFLLSPPDLAGLGEEGTTIGAEVLYRYENGCLTDEALWPWPMEERIFSETGLSPTWEASGGLWKTLDGVYGP